MWFFGSSHTDPPDRICKQPFNQDESCMVRSHWRKCQPCHSSSWNGMSRDRPSHLWMLIRLIPTSCDCDNIATTCRQRQHGCRLELMQGRRAAARARPFAETTGGLLRAVWTCADSAAVHKVSEVTYRNMKCFFFVLVCRLSVYLYHLLLYIFHTIYYDIRTWPDCTLVLVPVPHASQWVTTGWPVAVAAPVKQEQRRRALQKGTEDEWCFDLMLSYFHFLSSGSKILRKLETVGIFWLPTFFCNPYKWLTGVWYSLVSPLDSWSSIPTEHHPILFSSELPWPWQNLTVISVQIKKDRELESSFPS